jgi:hypothetical protein
VALRLLVDRRDGLGRARTEALSQLHHLLLESVAGGAKQLGHLLAALRGAPHGFRNAGDRPVRGLCLHTPTGYEEYFRQVHAAVAAGAVVDDDMLNEFRSRFNTTPHVR